MLLTRVMIHSYSYSSNDPQIYKCTLVSDPNLKETCTIWVSFRIFFPVVVIHMLYPSQCICVTHVRVLCKGSGFCWWKMKTFPLKTCLKHVIYANKNMGLHAHIYMPTPNPHWPLSVGLLGLGNIRVFYLRAMAAGPQIWENEIIRFFS